MCGIAGLFAHQSHDLAQKLFDALTVLQHRGQDAAGIVTCDNKRFFLCKGNGLLKDVVRTRHMQTFKGYMGIGHVRYPTAGSASSAESQPFYVNSPYGIALAHNGNLTNVEAIKASLYQNDLRHINTGSDSEVLLNVFASELGSLKKLNPKPSNIFAAVEQVYQRCEGGYAVVALLNGHGLLGFRDPNGVRPLVLGKRESVKGTEYMLASESVALDIQGFDLMRDVEPGEALFIDRDGKLHSRVCCASPQKTPCIFEFVYLARPDSIIDGINVYQSRLQMGQRLADKISREQPCHDIDVVMPIPDTSRTAALELATKLQIPYREGFVKNRYIGRTFIMPGQKLREKSVRQKLNVIDMEFRDKVVLLVDDSIVRGTTCRQIIEMAREAGARKVYFCSAAPPVRFQNVYGIDMPCCEELIAHNCTVDSVCEKIGADLLIYQDLEDLKEAVSSLNPKISQFDCSVFDGNYLAGNIDDDYLRRLAMKRNNCESSQSDNNQGENMGLYNSNTDC